MKQQQLKILVLCVFCVSSFSIYSAVTLPVDYTKFFAGTAVNSNGTDLEVGSTAALNSWYLIGTANGVSPTISPNNLTYSNYVDNSAGKKITMSSSISAARTSFYQFTGAAADLPGGGKTYYLSFILNVSAAPSGYVLLTNYINGTTAGGSRGRIQIKASTTSGNFQLQTLVSASGSPSITLPYNTNHLIVLKYDITTASSPAGTANGAATTTLFANPTLGAAEPISTSTITETNIANLDCIKALVINQQPGLAAEIAGLRMGANWTDVVKSGTNAVFNPEVKKLNVSVVSDTEWKINATDISGLCQLTVINMQGQTVMHKNLSGGSISEIQVNLPKGLYLVTLQSNNDKYVAPVVSK